MTLFARRSETVGDWPDQVASTVRVLRRLALGSAVFGAGALLVGLVGGGQVVDTLALLLPSAGTAAVSVGYGVQRILAPLVALGLAVLLGQVAEDTARFGEQPTDDTLDAVVRRTLLLVRVAVLFPVIGVVTWGVTVGAGLLLA